MTEAERLVDELTTLLYEVTTGWDDSAGGRQIVRCGACRRRADRAESVVHESDCPVYRLIRAEEANTAVIRANAEEIADLEDVRDALEAQVNALTAQMECRNELTARIRALEKERGQQAFADPTLASVERINALEAERDALRARAERAEAALDGWQRLTERLAWHLSDQLHIAKFRFKAGRYGPASSYGDDGTQALADFRALAPEGMTVPRDYEGMGNRD